jgi:hypothetical protein
MQKVSINAYEYNELNEIAKNKVKEYFNDFETFYQVEAEESLNKFCEIYNIKWQEWAIWGSYVNYEFLDTNLEDLSYIRLYKYIQNNIDQKYYTDCDSLTGVCYDNGLLEPIIKFMKKPYNITFKELLNISVKNWINEVEAEYNYTQSDDYISEVCIDNNYLFTEYGRFI